MHKDEYFILKGTLVFDENRKQFNLYEKYLNILHLHLERMQIVKLIFSNKLIYFPFFYIKQTQIFKC